MSEMEPPEPATDAAQTLSPRNKRATRESYLRSVRELSDLIIEVQRPIRVLDAVKWDDEVRARFLAAGGRRQPEVDADYYRGRPLPFDPALKREELHRLDRDIVRRLGQLNPVGGIMRRIIREYTTVVRMLEARGTRDFSLLSQELYGTPSDVFDAGGATIADLAHLMDETLYNIDASGLLSEEEEETVSGAEAVRLLEARLEPTFASVGEGVRVILSDGILADAAAGSDYLKIRKDAHFSQRELRVLEVHEGWVHIGTTLNGLAQPYCTFLGKGPPSATVTQEGLAIIMEVVAFASHPARLRRLTNRVRGVDMADRGATFLDIYRWLIDQGLSETEAYAQSARVFRGSTPEGGPFTKDLAYHKGFILIYNFLRLAVRKGLLDRIPLLFSGKVTLGDIRTLAELRDEGVIAPPRFLPGPFADLRGLAAWMSYSNFLNRVDLAQVERDYAGLL